MQTLVHYSMHFLLPAVVAWVFFRREWKKAYLLMLVTMFVDLDHLLANPVFDPHRCSIGYHPLHSIWAIMHYVVLLFFKKPWRILGIGLLLHMATDLLDCWWMMSNCDSCTFQSFVEQFLP